jgi:hypothetical protein
LQWLAAHSAVIFSGQVVSAGAAGGEDVLPDPGHMAPQTAVLQVNTGLRGVASGQTFGFTQWPGTEGPTLVPGQKVVLFLHQPNGAGIDSSVFGAFGVLRVGGADLVDVRPLLLLARQLTSAAPGTAGSGWHPGCPRGAPRRPFSPLAERAMGCASPIGPVPAGDPTGPIGVPEAQIVELLRTLTGLESEADNVREGEGHAY